MSKYFEYPAPFKRELVEMGYMVYRIKKASDIENAIIKMFSHPSNSKANIELFNDVRTSGSRALVKEMGLIAFAYVRYFLDYPQQFDHNIMNIADSALVAMWKRVFKHCTFQEKKLDMYHKTNMRLLSLELNLWEMLIEKAEGGEYWQHNDDMVKRREFLPKTMLSNGKGSSDKLRGRIGLGTQEGRSKTNFEYLCGLE